MRCRNLVAAPLLVAISGSCHSPAESQPGQPACTFTIESKALAETRRINVWTPPGYDREATARFPVLYMPDGGVAEDFPHITEAMQAAFCAGAIRPFVVVGIENTERRRDLTGPTTVDADRAIAKHVGGAATFRTFIRDELMPVIRARLRTTDETAIVGESLAGLFVVETFLLEPTLFDTYIAVDPSLWWNDHGLVRVAGERLGARGHLAKTLYLTSADEPDILQWTAALAQALQAAAIEGLVLHYVPRPDLHHDTIFRAMAPLAFRAVFAPPH